MSTKPIPTMCCRYCGSTNVWRTAWLDINTGKEIEDSDPPFTFLFCYGCELLNTDGTIKSHDLREVTK